MLLHVMRFLPFKLYRGYIPGTRRQIQNCVIWDGLEKLRVVVVVVGGGGGCSRYNQYSDIESSEVKKVRFKRFCNITHSYYNISLKHAYYNGFQIAEHISSVLVTLRVVYTYQQTVTSEWLTPRGQWHLELLPLYGNTSKPPSETRRRPFVFYLIR